jgi:hypothetical protein
MDFETISQIRRPTGFEGGNESGMEAYRLFEFEA